MKLQTLLFSGVLVTALGGGAWLVSENDRLRSELDSLTARALPSHKVRRTASASGNGFINEQTASKSPHGTAERDNTVAPQGSASPPGSGNNSPLTVRENADGTFSLVDAGGTWQRALTAEEMRTLSQTMNSQLANAVIKLPNGPSWSPGQAAGPPNTEQHGDYATAWASQSPDAGPEWLQLKYGRSVEISEINIHESYNPGALAKVSAVMPDGSQKVLWQGTEDPEDGIIERAVKVPPGIRSDQIRIELDTSRVPGWNEIDAVELVGTDGTRQWAAESTASSYYGQGRGNTMTFQSDVSGLLLLESGTVNSFNLNTGELRLR